LNSKPSGDPDVRSGRLVVADPYLATILYGKIEQEIERSEKIYVGKDANIVSTSRSPWFIAREKFNDENTTYTFPNGTIMKGSDIQNWGAIPPGTIVKVEDYQKPELFEGFREIGKDGLTAREIAGVEYNTASTIYFLNDGRVRTGTQVHEMNLDSLPKGTKMLVGYRYGGEITKERTATYLAGKKWNKPDTFYRIKETKEIISGDDIDPRAIPLHTLIFIRE
jgi:N-acetylmuramoyl-L-alanine amidase